MELDAALECSFEVRLLYLLQCQGNSSNDAVESGVALVDLFSIGPHNLADVVILPIPKRRVGRVNPRPRLLHDLARDDVLVRLL